MELQAADAAPASRDSGAGASAAGDLGDPGDGARSSLSSADVPHLLEQIEALKASLRERDQRKREMIRELERARKQAWEHKQEAEHAKQQVKQLIVDIEGADDPAISSDAIAALGVNPTTTGDGVQTVQECLQAQETRIKTMSGELNEAKMMANFYLRVAEERSEAIRSLEVEVERSRVKAVLDRHPCGEIFLPPDAFDDPAKKLQREQVEDSKAKGPSSPSRSSGGSSSSSSSSLPVAEEQLPALSDVSPGPRHSSILASVPEDPECKADSWRSGGPLPPSAQGRNSSPRKQP